MEKLTQSLSNALFENNYIKKTEIEIIQYGIEMFFICCLEMLAILCLAVCFNNFIETLIYLFAFIPIRIYSGGYHADTRLRCFIILLAVFGIFTVLNPLQAISDSVGIIIAISNLIFVFLWAPLANVNKPVAKSKQRIYRKRSLVLSVAALLITIVFCIYKINSIYAQAYVLGLLTAVISIIAGKIKNFAKGEKFNV